MSEVQPCERGRRVGDDVLVGLPVGRVRFAPRGDPRRRPAADGALPEGGLVEPVREADDVDGAVGEVREHHGGDPGEVRHQVAFGDRRRVTPTRREHPI
jgi:hypothetical protein